MKISWRATFIEASVAPSTPAPRARSTPPAPVGKEADLDFFEDQRLYASQLLERAEQLQQRGACRTREAAEEHEAHELRVHGLPLVKLEVNEEENRLDARMFDSFYSECSTATASSNRDFADEGEEVNTKTVLRRLSVLSDKEIPRSTSCSTVTTLASRKTTVESDWSSMTDEPEDQVCDSAQDQKLTAESDGDEVVTTIMVSNMPCRILEERMAEVLDANGLEGRYDLLFVPRSYRPDSNLGYAFINFLSNDDAESCMRLFAGYSFAGTSSDKACRVQPARIQGLENNIAQFCNGRRRKAPWLLGEASQRLRQALAPAKGGTVARKRGIALQ